MIKISHLRQGIYGIDVYYSIKGIDYSLHNVSENVVRCALGSDVDYLLTASYEIGFTITESDLVDFKKYRK